MRRTPVIAPLLALILAACAPAAGAQTLEERLLALEQRVRALEEENAALREQAAAAPAGQAQPTPAATTEQPIVAPAPAPAPTAPAPPAGPAVAKAVGKESELKVGGFSQVQAEIGDRGDSRWSDDNDRLFLRRVRLGVSGRFLEHFEWKTEMEAAGSLANASAIRAQLTDAFVDWRRTERFGVRGGQFKTPFGFEHLYSDTKLPFVERALGSDRLTLGRQAGLMLDGVALEKRFHWAVSAFNGTPANTSGNDDDRWVLMSRVGGVPAKWTFAGKAASWAIAANAYASDDGAVTMPGDFRFDLNPAMPGNDNVFRGKRSGLGADTQVVLGPVQFWAEWLTTSFRPDDDLPAADFDARSRAAHVTWLSPGGHFEPALRWDDFDPNDSAPDDDTSTWSAALGWLIKGHDLKLHATWMHVDAPPPVDVDDKLLLRFQVLF